MSGFQRIDESSSTTIVYQKNCPRGMTCHRAGEFALNGTKILSDRLKPKPVESDTRGEIFSE